ncbi:MAG: hypothetical protein KJP15_05755 [Gammaproteobacteria bacterium]|nr:hypothetical protein [Gammaproteobacteria bacterium]
MREAPMQGAIHLSLQREPDANLAADIQGRKHVTVFVVNASDDRVLGVGSRFVRSLYVNGKVCPVGYLSQLRAQPGRNGLRRLRAGYKAIEQTRTDEEFGCDITSIIADNTVAVRMLERGLPGLPDYRPLASLTTFVIPTRSRVSKRRHQVESAGVEDLRRIVSCLQNYLAQYQFSPYWDEHMIQDQNVCNNLSVDDFLIIRDGEEVSASVAIWDQRSFKQIIVNGYSKTLANIRPLLNIPLFLLRKPRLPTAPSELNLAYLSHLAVKKNDPEKFRDLISMARLAAAARGIDYLALGLTTVHPLHRVLSRSFPNYQYTSKLYTVHWDKRTRSDQLHERIPHVEVAVL